MAGFDRNFSYQGLPMKINIIKKRYKNHLRKKVTYEKEVRM